MKAFRHIAVAKSCQVEPLLQRLCLATMAKGISVRDTAQRRHFREAGPTAGPVYVGDHSDDCSAAKSARVKFYAVETGSWLAAVSCSNKDSTLPFQHLENAFQTT